MARRAIPILYKGAGPGTHWHQTDPRLDSLGFTAGGLPVSANAVIRHITAYSYPSAYLSFTTSFAIARGYALGGPKGIASDAHPGYVYEIDLTVLDSPPHLVNPVHAIAARRDTLAHQHNGSKDLITEIAQAATEWSPAHQCGGRMLTPSVTQNMQALIFAIRDAELLVASRVPPEAIVNRHDVF